MTDTTAMLSNFLFYTNDVAQTLASPTLSWLCASSSDVGYRSTLCDKAWLYNLIWGCFKHSFFWSLRVQTCHLWIYCISRVYLQCKKNKRKEKKCHIITLLAILHCVSSTTFTVAKVTSTSCVVLPKWWLRHQYFAHPQTTNKRYGYIVVYSLFTVCFVLIQGLQCPPRGQRKHYYSWHVRQTPMG